MLFFFQGKLMHIKLSYDWALCIRRLKKNKKNSVALLISPSPLTLTVRLCGVEMKSERVSLFAGDDE